MRNLLLTVFTFSSILFGSGGPTPTNPFELKKEQAIILHSINAILNAARGATLAAAKDSINTMARAAREAKAARAMSRTASVQDDNSYDFSSLFSVSAFSSGSLASYSVDRAAKVSTLEAALKELTFINRFTNLKLFNKKFYFSVYNVINNYSAIAQTNAADALNTTVADAAIHGGKLFEKIGLAAWVASEAAIWEQIKENLHAGDMIWNMTTAAVRKEFESYHREDQFPPLVFVFSDTAQNDPRMRYFEPFMEKILEVAEPLLGLNEGRLGSLENRESLMRSILTIKGRKLVASETAPFGAGAFNIDLNEKIISYMEPEYVTSAVIF